MKDDAVFPHDNRKEKRTVPSLHEGEDRMAKKVVRKAKEDLKESNVGWIKPDQKQGKNWPG